jgi:hypothetical protein
MEEAWPVRTFKFDQLSPWSGKPSPSAD